MKHKLFICILAAMMVCGLAFGVMAEEGKDKINQSEEKGKGTPDVQAVADLSLAGQLAEYGRRTNNPTAMIAAAQIMKNTPFQDKKQDKTSEGASGETGQKSSALETPEKLLTDAQALAKQQGQEDIAAMAEKESKLVAQRGRVGGQVRHVDRILPGDTDTYTLTFKAGEEAIVAVIGDGDCDLDLKVYDQNGNLIAQDTDDTDRCLATWTPKWTGKFYVKIKNYCSVYANYILASN